MAEATHKSPGTDELAAELEQKIIKAKMLLLDEAVAFVQLDRRYNEQFLVLLGVLVEYVKKDPAAALSGSGGNIDALVTALRAKAEGGTSVAGNDIVGGGALSDLVDAIINIITKEKDFIMALIRLIVCGC